MARPNLQDQGPLWILIRAVVILIGLCGFEAYAQQTPPAKTDQAQTAPSQAATMLQTQPPTLDDVLLQETDADDIPTDLFSFVSIEYDHGSFTGGKSNNRERIKGEQDFGPNHRFGFGYEIPVIKGFGFNVDGGSSLPSGRGVGDIKLNTTAVLGETSRFNHAAKVEITFPSAPDTVKGAGQLVLKMAWSFSTPLGEKTTLNGIFAYNKAVKAPEGTSGLNNFEPEAVLVRQITGWMAAFLDYDTYQDFVTEEFGQTLKGGLTFRLDRAGRWSLSPYAQFPLNHFTSMTNIKSDYGIELIRRY
jgi:hypothetical protein